VRDLSWCVGREKHKKENNPLTYGGSAERKPEKKIRMEGGGHGTTRSGGRCATGEALEPSVGGGTTDSGMRG